MNYNDQYVVSLPGDFIHIESSIQDLSCSLVMEVNTKLMGLLRWDRVTSTFAFVGALPLTSFTSDAAVLNASVPIAKQLIMAAMTVGAKC